jgi:hypothetical protein
MRHLFNVKESRDMLGDETPALAADSLTEKDSF